MVPLSCIGKPRHPPKREAASPALPLGLSCSCSIAWLTMTFSIVLITTGNRYGIQVARRLKERGVELAAVVVNAPPRRRGLRALARTIRHAVARVALRTSGVLEKLCPNVVWTGALNSERMIRDLQTLAPDFIVQGGCGGILRPPIIAVPKHGILNCHPALLPWIPGSGVVGWSLKRNIPVGATLHYIDAGIDTGPVIERRLLRVPAEATTLADLEAAADELTVTMFVDVTTEQLSRGHVPSGHRQTASPSPMHRWLSPGERQEVENLVRHGTAHSLFESWQGRCENAERLVLPWGAEAAP